MKIISIDTGNPELIDSTTAVVSMDFDGPVVKRNAITFSGTFEHQKESIVNKCMGADFVVIEKIDSTNKYLARAIITEQIGLMKFLEGSGITVHELIRSGRKEVITDDLLQKINLWSEGPHKTHHHDVREATRNGLYFMAKNEGLNKILSEYVRHFF